MGQWIKGSFFSTKNYFDSYGACQKIIKSSLYKVEDNISQGYKPSMDGTGILFSWKNKPLAYHGIPTLNNMLFSKPLWEKIHENPFIKASMDNHCWWGEDCHRDSSEVLLDNVAIRVNDFHCIDNNLVIGDIDLMDTAKGLNIYSLAKTGAIGNSSRGFGDLDPIGNGLSNVREDTYLAVDWDCVGFPAVPQCLSMYASETSPEMSQSIMDLETGLREQIASAIKEGIEKMPDNPWMQNMYNALNLKDKEAKIFPIASSVNKAFKKQFPDSNKVRKEFKK